MNDNVIKINEIRPKIVNQKYKKVPITLTYLPRQKKWRWSIKIVSETTYSEEVRSENCHDALKAAKKYIDKQQLGD